MDISKIKEFKPTSWSIDNRTSVYFLVLILTVFGIFSYNSLPKEQFPEIVIPQIIVSTVYPGTSPVDMENLVTRPIEKNLKSINGVKKITSKSIQDFSLIIVEFNTGIEIEDAKTKVKDAVDKTKRDLPTDLDSDPDVMDVDISQMPIRYINISGDYSLSRLKDFAEDLQDEIELLPEITRVDIVGAMDREIQINVDMYRMQAASITFSDIERAVANENVTVAGGNIDLSGMSRSVRVVGEFSSVEQIRNVIVHSSSGAAVYLKDIAEVVDSFKEQESFSRFDGKNVITLNVVKKSGKNLLDASDKIDAIIAEFQVGKFPSDLSISITNDQSKQTRSILNELNNTIIIGFILVTIVLMFFMGLTNAVFVALSVPLSMFLAYLVLPGIGFTLNMLVMFSFIFALGIVVDDAIVVIENTHRVFHLYKLDIRKAAKVAAGEVFVPILSGTLTTLAPFVPLMFWPGTVGEFMFYIPATLIITLLASLFVAYIINPVFAVDFMSHDDKEQGPMKKSRLRLVLIGLLLVSLIGFLSSGFRLGTTGFGIGTFFAFLALVFLWHNTYGFRIILHFQHVILPKLMHGYQRLVRWSLVGRRPYRILYSTFGLLLFTFVLTGLFGPQMVFFPDSDPQYINVFAKLPVGTEIKVTDSVAREIEKRVYAVVGTQNPDVESVVTNVALGASDDTFDEGTITSNKAKVSVNFVEYGLRKNRHTSGYMDQIREKLKDLAGVEITVDQNKNGPPTGKPVNVELSGENLDMLVETSLGLKKYLDSLNIPGVEQFKLDFERKKPEIIVDVDRVRANHEGITTAQVGMEMRTAILGKETSKYRDGEDQYPIQLRYTEEVRKNIDKLMNLQITYKDMNSGTLRQIPLSSVATIQYRDAVGGINRKNLKRVINISSDVTGGFTAIEVVESIERALPRFQSPSDIDIKMTGEQEDQKETSDFLVVAMLLSMFLILFILITQFNSVSKPIIILSEVLFSVIGVLLGFIIFQMPMSIIMSGMGLVALAGIVVRNGILLVEFTDVLHSQGLRTREAIIRAGETRITPVLLTASATILGLIPLAIGFNIDFAGLFTSFTPHVHFGGENMMFFGPLAWTIIFGLVFATFLTLILIPVMYFIMHANGVRTKRILHRLSLKH